MSLFSALFLGLWKPMKMNFWKQLTELKQFAEAAVWKIRWSSSLEFFLSWTIYPTKVSVLTCIEVDSWLWYLQQQSNFFLVSLTVQILDLSLGYQQSTVAAEYSGFYLTVCNLLQMLRWIMTSFYSFLSTWNIPIFRCEKQSEFVAAPAIKRVCPDT